MKLLLVLLPLVFILYLYLTSGMKIKRRSDKESEDYNSTAE